MGQLSLFEAFNIFSALFFLISISSVILGVVVLAKSASEKINRTLFLLCLVIGIESFGYGVTFWTTNIQDVYFFMGIACVGYCLIWPVSTQFLVEFNFGKISRGWLLNIIFLYLVAVFYIVTWFTGLTASADFERIKYGWFDHPNQTIFYYLYIVYLVYSYASIFGICIIAEITYKKRKKYCDATIKKQGDKIKQIRLMFISAFVSANFGILFNIIFPVCGIKIPSIGFLFMSLFVFVCVFCIIKYHTFILKKEISPAVIDHVGEIVVVISENFEVIYANNTFFRKLKLEQRDPALINLSDFISDDLKQLISLEEFKKGKKGVREIELLCYDKKTHIQTKMISIPVVIPKKRKVIVLTFSDISHRVKKLMENQEALLKYLAFAADGKSQDLHEHIYRMSKMSVCIAEYYKQKYPFCDLPENMDDIERAALLHDIGKISIRDNILNKPGKFTLSEFEAIKSHTTFGYNIMSCMEGDVNKIAALVVLNHHENWDGTGYPNGLLKEEIPLIARIVSVADVMDALLTDRVYKTAMTVEEVENFLCEQKGKKFDPSIIDVIFENHDDIMRCFDNLVNIYYTVQCPSYHLL